MRLHKLITFILIIWLALSCNSANYTTVRHVKPLNRNRYYNPSKDKRKKRVHTVKKKILKRSKAVKPPRQKKPKKKQVQSDSTQNIKSDSLNIEKPTNEPDSTGSF